MESGPGHKGGRRAWQIVRGESLGIVLPVAIPPTKVENVPLEELASARGRPQSLRVNEGTVGGTLHRNRRP